MNTDGHGRVLARLEPPRIQPAERPKDKDKTEMKSTDHSSHDRGGRLHSRQQCDAHEQADRPGRIALIFGYCVRRVLHVPGHTDVNPATAEIRCRETEREQNEHKNQLGVRGSIPAELSPVSQPVEQANDNSNRKEKHPWVALEIMFGEALVVGQRHQQWTNQPGHERQPKGGEEGKGRTKRTPVGESYSSPTRKVDSDFQPIIQAKGIRTDSRVLFTKNIFLHLRLCTRNEGLHD